MTEEQGARAKRIDRTGAKGEPGIGMVVLSRKPSPRPGSRASAHYCERCGRKRKDCNCVDGKP